MEGDAVLASRLMQASQDLAIDWDRLLAPYLGAELVSGGSRSYAAHCLASTK